MLLVWREIGVVQTREEYGGGGVGFGMFVAAFFVVVGRLAVAPDCPRGVGQQGDRGRAAVELYITGMPVDGGDLLAGAGAAPDGGGRVADLGAGRALRGARLDDSKAGESW